MALNVTVNGFPDGGMMPRRFACEGGDLSPALEWSGEPKETRSFALIVDDPDAPSGTWNHWIAWDIPASVHMVAEGGAESAGVQGANDFGERGYGGPCPPRGKGAHRYFFRLLALDVQSLRLSPGVKRPALEKALRGHILDKAEYHGLYRRD